MLRVIREVQPRWVVGENVFGLVNWNGGMVFDEVQSDLEAAGYEVQAYVLPAASVGAPHRRDRVWFVAYSDNKRRDTRFGQIQKSDGEIPKWNYNAELSDAGNNLTTNPCDVRLQRRMLPPNETTAEQQTEPQNARGDKCRSWEDFPTKPPICSGNDGLSFKLDGITFSKWRTESLKAYGNAVVPQVVYQIFKTINEYEHRSK